MKEERFFYHPYAASQQELPEEEGQHAWRVLRMKEGDTCFLIDGQGTFHRAVLTVVDRKHVCYTIEESTRIEKAWKGHIHLVIAPTKMMERMEWMVEKAVETGIDEITFIQTKNSERKQINKARVERIAIAAMKQSRKPYATLINDMTDWKTFIQASHEGAGFITHCHESPSRTDLFDSLTQMQPSPERVTILIGPEGDFTPEEVAQAIEKGFISASLGQSRFRTETAGLAAVMMAGLALRKK